MSHAGVAIYIRENLQACVKLKNSVDSALEFIFVEIKNDSQKILVGCTYRPNRRIDLSEYMALIEDVTLKYEDVVIAGDFNCDILSDRSLVDKMRVLGMHSVNTSVPTHYTSTSCTLLDVYFVVDKTKVLLYDQLDVPQFSKHDLIFLSYDFKLTKVSKTFT